MMMLVLHREHARAASTKAIVQSLLSPSAGPKAWDQYIAEGFPWIMEARKQEERDLKSVLHSEVARGPLQITAMQDRQHAKFRSRLLKKPEELQHLPGVARARRLRMRKLRLPPTRRIRRG